MGTETGITWSQAKQCLGLPEAEKVKDPSPTGFRRNMTFPTP